MMNNEKQVEEDKEMMGAAIVVIWIAIVIFAVYLWVSREPDTSGEDNSGPTREEARCKDANRAYVMSHVFVEQRLRSPSTADFPFITDSAVSVQYRGICRHRVKAYVDAQNGFGATVRQAYTAELKYNKGKESWTLENLTM